MGATVPVGKKGDYFTVHSLGNVQRHAADGSAVWERTNTSLYADWQVELSPAVADGGVPGPRPDGVQRGLAVLAHLGLGLLHR
ncbi:hypothetical protein NQP46_28785 [Streptomyces albus]|nr:hypothetical protein NQP46_28785 [Streptomyces albus]